MIDPLFENRSGSPSGHYSRWPDPWRREDDWGPITAAVIFFILLAGLIVYGSGARVQVGAPLAKMSGSAVIANTSARA
jgi:hypothetical protein